MDEIGEPIEPTTKSTAFRQTFVKMLLTAMVGLIAQSFTEVAFDKFVSNRKNKTPEID